MLIAFCILEVPKRTCYDIVLASYRPENTSSGNRVNETTVVFLWSLQLSSLQTFKPSAQLLARVKVHCIFIDYLLKHAIELMQNTDSHLIHLKH